MDEQLTRNARRLKGGRQLSLSEAKPFLSRLLRLRIVTARQAHALHETFARKSLRNTHKRLDALVRRCLLRVDSVEPQRGAVSAHCFRLTYRGLVLLQREGFLHLTARPPQHLLKYLLFRNEVYAAAREAGWAVGSPVLTPPQNHAAALKLFNTWVLATKSRALETLQRQPCASADVVRAQQELERLPRFLPTSLTFEYLVRVDEARKPQAVVLFVMDDPRKSIERQVAGLPNVPTENLRVCIRDSESRYDCVAQKLYAVSPRLRALRKAVAEKYGPDILETDTLFPTLWAHRIHLPKS